MQAQPYRKGKGREPGPALDAMQRGRTSSGFNPQDAVRAMMKKRDQQTRGFRQPRQFRQPRGFR
jgi:hypothetical protein